MIVSIVVGVVVEVFSFFKKPFSMAVSFPASATSQLTYSALVCQIQIISIGQVCSAQFINTAEIRYILLKKLHRYV